MVSQNYKYEKALIIDDELDTCLLLSMVLKRIGINSANAHTLKDGIDKIEAYAPQLIFLDNNLPDGVGTDHIEQLKQTYPTSKLIIITAMSSLRDKAIALGANGFLEKPLDMKKILGVL